jgi:hypothetical protein
MAKGKDRKETKGVGNRKKKLIKAASKQSIKHLLLVWQLANIQPLDLHYSHQQYVTESLWYILYTQEGRTKEVLESFYN